ncbi:MAG: ABC transporter substrate-binding protein [Breznakibacter sp.]
MSRLKGINAAVLLWATGLLVGHSLSAKTVTDMLGRKVQVPDQIKSVYTDRFTSLIVFAIDPDLACNYTFELGDEAKRYISSVYYEGKTFTRESDETILQLAPDVVVLGTFGGLRDTGDADRMQKKLRIPVLVLDIRLENYRAMFSLLGNVLGRPQAAARIDGFIRQYIEPLGVKARQIPKAQRSSVYYAEGPKGQNTEPCGSIHSQVMNYLDVPNVAQTTLGGTHGMSPVSMEQVLAWNPQTVLVWTGFPPGLGMDNLPDAKQSTLSHILSDASWANIKAVKDKKVYQIPVLPFGWFDRPPSSNCLGGVFWTAKTLYPQWFDFDLNEVAKLYFSLFYHVELSPSDVSAILDRKPDR